MEPDLRLETEVAFTHPSVGANHINNKKAPAALNLKKISSKKSLKLPRRAPLYIVASNVVMASLMPNEK